MSRFRRDLAALAREQDELESFAGEIAFNAVDPRCYYCDRPWSRCACRCGDCGGSIAWECACEQPNAEANPRATHHAMFRTSHGDAFTACAKPVTDKIPTDPVRVTCKSCRRWMSEPARSPYRARLYERTLAQRQAAITGADLAPTTAAADRRAARSAAKAAARAAQEARESDVLRRQVPLFANPERRRRRGR